MAVIDTLVQQILAQNTTDKWTGQGYGSAEANAKAMAKLLADAGITDIKQFGKVDKYEPVEVTGYTLNGNTVQRPRANLYYEEIPEWSEGNGWTTTRRDLTPAEIAQVKTNYGIVQTDSDGMVTGVIPATSVVEKDGKLMGVTGQTFGNKVTGQAIERGTGRWQKQGGEGLFGGTGEGEGNTGYRVQFAADGTPVFYTTKGSSSDVADIMPIIQLGLMATGAGGALGNALLGTGANQLAASALGGALLGGGTAALTDQSILKGALLGGAGGALSNVLGETLTAGEPVDFVGGTTESINDALQQQFVNDLKAAGVTNVSEFLTNVGGNAGSFIPTDAPVAPTEVIPEFQGPMPNLEVTAPLAPTVAPTLSDLITAIVATPENITTTPEAITTTPESIVETPVENIEVTESGRTPSLRVDVNPYDFGNLTQEQYNQMMGIEGPYSGEVNENTEAGYEGGSLSGEELANLQVTAQQAQPEIKTVEQVIAELVPELVVTGNAPQQQEQAEIPLIQAPPIDTILPEVTTIAEKPSSITDEIIPTPIINAPPIDTTLPEKTYTTKEIIDMVRLGMLGASVLGAGAAATQDSGPTGFDIVPVPTEWTPPQATKVADFTPLTPIDFGTKDLLKGTQWEKLLSPTYGQIPAPMQFNQPSDMSYDRLMSILGSGRDTLPSQALTINDVISGIQNQYGQTPTSSMG